VGKRFAALQGAFAEHQVMLQKLTGKNRRLEAIEVRTLEELKRCDALIIPGGGLSPFLLSLCGPTTTHIFAPATRVRADLARPTESTTIALLARLSGLMEPLCEFVKTKPVWGTCAGAILLAQVVSNPKRGGQELLGGVSVKITRNGWGSQVRCGITRTEMTDLTACSVFL
jgi:5'-phosphate synthase pdxT subunit